MNVVNISREADATITELELEHEAQIIEAIDTQAKTLWALDAISAELASVETAADQVPVGVHEVEVALNRLYEKLLRLKWAVKAARLLADDDD